ncbi:MAG: hypothetical protein ACKVU4_10310 [Phycisphaerales bacterium]
MTRVIVVHWNKPEGDDRAKRLRAAGYEVAVLHEASGGKQARAWRANPPDAFVIDLARLPSHGRAVAGFIRDTKATRPKPIVFVGGEGEPLAKTKRLFPDAAYSTWGRIKGDLKHALARPPAEPVRPGVMGGYSGTPLPKKLGIKPDSAVALLGAPDGFGTTLGTLPEGVRVLTQPRGRARTVVLFVMSSADLAKRFPAALKAMDDPGALWIAWPKKASGVPCDMGEQDIRDFGLARGLVDYKICAIDHTWSGLCFARRRAT